MRVLRAKLQRKQQKWRMVLLLSQFHTHPSACVFLYFTLTVTNTQSDRPMSFVPACVVFITGQCSDKHKGLHWKAGIPWINPAIVFPDPWFRSAAELVHIPLDLWRHVEAAGSLWLWGWMNWCLQISNSLADSFICPSAGTYANVCICVPVELPVCHPDCLAEILFESRVKYEPQTSCIFSIYKVLPKVNWLSDLHFELFVNVRSKEEIFWSYTPSQLVCDLKWVVDINNN